MSDKYTGGIMLTIGEDGKASFYDDTYDITIHCESREEQEEVVRILQNTPHWIPCSERLPEEHTRVIGYMAWKAMTAIEYQHGRWYSIDHLEPLPDEAVSYWMPLPEPPRG